MSLTGQKIVLDIQSDYFGKGSSLIFGVFAKKTNLSFSKLVKMNFGKE